MINLSLLTPDLERERIGAMRVAVVAVACAVCMFAVMLALALTGCTPAHAGTPALASQLASAASHAAFPADAGPTDAPDVFEVEVPEGHDVDVSTPLGPVPVPAERAGDTLVAIAVVMAALLRGATALMRTPLMGSFWTKVPPFVQWAILALLTGLLAFADTVGTGAPWKTALATALAGLFTSWMSQKVQKKAVPQ